MLEDALMQGWLLLLVVGLCGLGVVGILAVYLWLSWPGWGWSE